MLFLSLKHSILKFQREKKNNYDTPNIFLWSEREKGEKWLLKMVRVHGVASHVTSGSKWKE